METRNPYTQGLMDALDLAEQVIDSLQQEQWEVDLEKETIIDYAHNHYHYDKDFDGDLSYPEFLNLLQSEIIK